MMIPALLNLLPKLKTSTLAHDAYFERLIRQEFGRLKVNGQTYLDYTGGGLYAASQVKTHQERLLGGVFGNPHSTNPTSAAATDLCDQARQKVLDYFNAEDYYCIFTPNASGALKLIGESFPWAKDSEFLALADNHNSVNGIREFCGRAGGKTSYAPIKAEDLTIDGARLRQLLSASHPDRVWDSASLHGPAPKLFAYPAQSNVSGLKHDQGWVNEAANHGWYTLLDAAAFAPTNRLDLKAVSPDFVTLSFYKIFGYPTGLGCLLVRKDRFDLLRKPWFAGGTVRLAAVAAHEHRLHDDHERFEDGTINYLDLPAVTDGLAFIERVGIDRITERVASLSAYLCRRLRALRHANGQPLVRIFGPEDRADCGGNLIFTLHDAGGSRIHFQEVEAQANARNISIRSGCFCNPGIDEVNNDISGPALTEYFTTEDGGNYHEMSARLGKMRGATRVSVGLATSQTDVDAFVALLRAWRC